MGGGQVLTACVGEEAGAGLAEPLSGQREQDGRNAQIATFAKSADLATWRAIHAAGAQGRADLRRRRSRRPLRKAGTRTNPTFAATAPMAACRFLQVKNGGSHHDHNFHAEPVETRKEVEGLVQPC